MDQAQNLRNIIRMQNASNTDGVKRARIITVTSGKGGVGKSSISINLAMQMRKLGKEVIIFDADFGLANIEVMFGAVPKYNLADMIYKGMGIKDILIKGPNEIGFISGGSGVAGLTNMTKDQVAYLIFKLQELETMADVIIIDTGAGISDSVLEFVASSAEVLLVTTPEPTSITDSYALLKALNTRNGYEKDNTVIKMIANRVNDYDDGKALFEKLSVVVNKFLNVNLEFLGFIPLDNNIAKSVIQQSPISIAYPNSPGTKAFVELTEALLENKQTEAPKKGLGQMFLKMFKNKNK